jgi:diguanylate cyclase
LLERLGFRSRRDDYGFEPEGTEPEARGGIGSDILGRIAQFLERHRLDPSPFTLTTAYEFLSGENGKLRREIEERIDSLEPVTIAWLKSVAEAEVEDPNEQFDTIFDLLEANISQFSSTTQTAQRATREYGAVLASHAAELKKADEGQRQLVQVATVVAAMVQRTKKLEEQLVDSQKQAKALKSSLDEVQRKANQDHLTGLPNRRAFDRLYEEQIIAAQSEIEPLCIAFCDVDHFKQVNDTHGHEAGDRVLKAIARRLASISDDRCHVARHGGEEFVMLFRGCTLEEAFRQLDALREDLADRRLVNRKNDRPIGRVTFSAGVADVFAYDTPRAALAAADGALYAAKEQGRNRVVAAEG